MRLLIETKGRNWYLVKEWTTGGGLPARIQQCKWAMNDPESDIYKMMAEQIPGYKSSLHDHFTGYVRIPDGDKTEYYDSQEIDVHGGVTFCGELDEEAGRWIGFDLAHYNDERMSDEVAIAYATVECERLSLYLTRPWWERLQEKFYRKISVWIQDGLTLVRGLRKMM